MNAFELESLVSSLQEGTYCLVTPGEAEAQKLEAIIQNILRPSDDEVVYFPGFVQAGVFRFESARKVIAKRLHSLFHLSRNRPRLIVTSWQGYTRAIPSPHWMENNSHPVSVGETHDLDSLLSTLQTLGYSEREIVEDVCEYSVRGSILDVWSPAHKTPVRIEFFGDDVENIRLFRAADQRSYEKLQTAFFIPSREFVWPLEDDLTSAIEKFNHAILHQNLTGQTRMNLLENLRHHVPFPAIDDLFYLFNDEKHQSLKQVLEKGFSYKPLFLGDAQAFNQKATETEKLYEDSLSSGQSKGFLAGKVDYIFPALKLTPEILPLSSPYQVPDEILIPLQNGKKFSERASALQSILKEKPELSVLFVTPSLDVFLERAGLLGHYFQINTADIQELKKWDLHNLDAMDSIDNRIFVAEGKWESGIYLSERKQLVLSLPWLQGFGAHEEIDDFTETQSSSRERAEVLLQAQFADYTTGDLVVHVQHGIARFQGVVTLTVQDITADFLALEYSGNDKVYVPIHKMNLVQKFIGSSADTSLDSLKKQIWEKRKAKAKEDAEKLARQLMEHQAKRTVTPGHMFARIGDDYLSFESAFPYDDTPDQIRAVREIMTDMSSSKAMDRLLCGDVGFGKTEVAMRACYRAILDGKQVAFLVPTTVLAHQHYRSLKERFQGFGVEMAVLDRSVSSGAAIDVLDKIRKGKLDLLVGTHRILSKDIEFKDLGLLVVDEEHRFGVLQKEKIKNMSYGVDVLTMTATPIPRTLQMAMVGLRDLSLLATPPKARMAVKTLVCPHEETIIRDAILYEMGRGGQLFFVHNRVEELGSVKEYISKLVPNARLAIGHGKMSQKELEETIIGFIDQKFDILLCTTIIESGIDMPNVNTIIVQNADHFGLAQLYQLRGRVGRRASRGYAFFLTSPNAHPKDEGMRRLDILKEHQELGSGFVIASHDMEMRGSGNILGDEQKGKVNDVGLETYAQMLDDAIKHLGGIKVRHISEVEIHVPFSVHIPEDYITDPRVRLKIYRRFFGTRSEEALQNLILECQDRFGALPKGVTYLTEMARLRRLLMVIGATSLTVGDDFSEIKLSKDVLQGDDDDSEILVKRILDVCNRQMKGVRITPDGRILLGVRKKTFHEKNGLLEIKKLISLIAGETNG